MDNDIPITYIRKKNNHKSNKFRHSKVSASKIEMINSNSASSKTKTNYNDLEGINNIFNNEKNIEYNNQRNDLEFNNNKSIISKVRLNRACIYLWFCFVRRNRNINNVLINEGMDLISRRLDIFIYSKKCIKMNKKMNPY